jgi:DNA-binding transcriptional MerR regulator
MYIGELSKRTGASQKAIRHYEEIGILANIERAGKYRVYDEHHVTIVSMVKRAQGMGFKLADIAPIVHKKHKENSFPLAFAEYVIQEKREHIKAEIAQAKQLDAELATLAVELKELFSGS